MATLKELETSYQNSNVQNFLKIIAGAEGVKYGYNTLFGNTYISNLSSHPNTKVPFTDKNGMRDYSTAAGAYQFLYDTWTRLKNRYGFNNFSGRNQDLAAIALITENGAINDVKSGDYKTAINKLGGIWASLPSSKYTATQPNKTWEEIGVENNPTGIKKWMLEMPAAKLFTLGTGAANTIQNNENGVLAGIGEVAGQISDYTPNIVAGAGNFALRSVVILAAIALVILGFYFMFKQEVAGAIKAVM